MKLANRSAMRLVAMVVLTFAALPCSLAAQAQTQPSTQAGTPPQGTVSQQNPPAVLMAVELSKALDSKKAKSGDPVEAKTLQDMKAPNGTDIPRGSKVIGHVTQASAHSKDQPQAQLGFVFEKIVTRSGQEFPLRGVLQAVNVPQNAPPNAGGGFGPGTVGGEQQGGSGGGQQQPGMTGQAGSQSGQMSGAGHAGGGSAMSSGEAGATGSEPTTAPATSGVSGLKDVQLTQGEEPTLSSSSRNIHLDSGTMVTVRVVPTPVGR